MANTAADYLQRTLDGFRLRVSRADAIGELCLLGVISGILAAGVIIAFRMLVEGTQSAFLDGRPHDYESLAPWLRLLLPVVGGLLLGLLWQMVPESARRVGVPHILERLDYYQGRLPLGNALLQFAGGALALISGHSVGREGPSIHLGAASSNLPAQQLRLPNNALRVVAACGTAAGIAATFNTPLAGVAFVLEVMMMESSVAAFAPVILATVSATTLGRLVYGEDLAFSVPALTLGSLTELPYILLLGVSLGVVSALFIRLLSLFQQRSKKTPIWLGPGIAGLITGIAALEVPEVMGIGYDTVNLALLGELSLGLMAAMVAVKVLATTAAIGLGVPGGIIGPTLVIGAMGGGLFGAVEQHYGLIPGASLGFHAMIGMGAMMAGTLQAPLAALLAILELTGNPNIIFPGMLAVIAATLTSGYLHGRESVFQSVLRNMGVDYRRDRLARTLRQVGVGAMMDRNPALLPRLCSRQRVDQELTHTPRWVLVRPDGAQPYILPAVDLVRALREYPERDEFDLDTIRADRHSAVAVDIQASLQEALEQLEASGAEALYVTRLTVPGLPRVYGVLTREHIESGYRY